MKKFKHLQRFLFLLIALSISNIAFGQLTGTKTIPGTYATIAAAITDLNTVGVGAGGVTFNVAAGYTETFATSTSGLITATGTSGNPIIFQKSGAGANPIITAAVGVSTTVDGIIVLRGSDYITFDGIDLTESATNITATTQMEWGFALVKTSATDGSQNNIIKNCTITLNKANTASAGIYSANHTDASTTVLTVTDLSGTNSNNKIDGNTVSNAFTDIYFIGFNDVTPFTYYDQGNEIGFTAGNTLSNYGGASTNYAIYIRNNNNFKISNNNISNSGTTSTTRGIYLAGCTNASGDVNYNTINITSAALTNQITAIESAITGAATINMNFNNVTLNHASATTGTLYGLYNNAAAITNLSISNNTFSATTSGTGATYCIYSSGAITSTVNVNNNTISSLTLSNATASQTIGLIYVSGGAATATTSISNNSFSGVTYSGTTGGTGTLYGIYHAGTPLALTINGNTYNNLNLKTAGSMYFIYNSNATNNMTISNNIVSGTFAKTVAGGTVYGYYDYGSPTGGTATLTGNNFSNITLTGATTFYGIQHYTSTTQTMVFTNNTISNITGGSSAIYGIYQGYGAAGNTVNGNTVNTITSTGSIYGLYLGASSAPTSLTAYNNTVYNLNTTGAATIYGIYNALGTATSIYKNNIYNLQANNASGIVNGIYNAGGALTYIYNNFVSDLKTPVSTGAISVVGLNIAGGTTVGAYYNTIYLNASSTGGTFGSSGIYKSSTTTGDLRNNIVVNASTPGATGLTVAYRWSGAYNATYYAATSNNNCFYAGTPSATNLIFYDGTNSDQTIDAYKTRVSTRDNLSFTENPPFINVATTPYNLHLSNVATLCESNGTPVTAPIAVSVDFDNDARNATTPDVGADEGPFIILNSPPLITYTPLVNTLLTTPRTLVATITDVNGVGSGANQPVLYWKINAAASYTGPVAPTSVAGNDYTYDFGAGVSAGDVVSYFIVAQDNAAIPMVGSYPGGATCTTNPPLASVGPPTPSTYVIIGYLCGTKTVGTGGDYPTITAAVNALNLNILCGSLTFNLLDATYPSETFPLVINANSGSSATNTVTFKPATGVVSTITGAVNSDALIKINGASYINFDGSNTVGGTTKDLTITNTSTTTPKVILLGSVGTTAIVGNSIKNCNIINGFNTSSALVISDIAGTAGYFTNTTIQNNSIQRAYIGIYTLAAVLAGNGNNTLISNNDLTTTGTNAIRLAGIYVQGVDGATVTNNLIGNFDNVSSEIDRGIWFATGTTNSTISGNTISTLSSTGGAMGIAVTSALASVNVMVTNNTISGITSTGTTSTYGIYMGGATSGVTIQKNKISDIKNSNAGGYSAIGVALASTLAAANTTLSNNIIFDIAGYGYTSTTTDNGFGINILSGGGYNLYYNTVSLATNQTISGSPACLIINSAVVNPVDIRNNVFSNTETMGTERYAIMCNAANTIFSYIDNNDYYTSGPNIGYMSAANQVDIAAWRTATGKDVNSFTAQPFFTSATNLHLIANSNCGIDGKGTPIAGITTDYDEDTRNTTTPDPGADEFTGVALTAPTAANQNGCFGGTIPDLTATVVGTAKWFSDVALTNLVFTGTPFATGETAVGVYTYYVMDSLGTCNSPATTVTLTIDDVPAQPSVITGPTTPLQSTSQVYSVTNVPGTTYNWTFPSDWTQTAGGTTNSITLTIGIIAGDVTCTPSNTCGNGTARSLYVTPQPDAISKYTNNNNVSISPNPSNGLIAITLKGFSNDVKLQLQNAQGKSIYTSNFVAESANFTKTLDLSNYPKGIYFIQINNNGKISVNKVVLQ